MGWGLRGLGTSNEANEGMRGMLLCGYTHQDGAGHRWPVQVSLGLGQV